MLRGMCLLTMCTYTCAQRRHTTAVPGWKPSNKYVLLSSFVWADQRHHPHLYLLDGHYWTFNNKILVHHSSACASCNGKLAVAVPINTYCGGQYVICGNSGCGLETHTALNCTMWCIYGSLNHTPHSHKSHIELQTHITYYIAELLKSHDHEY